MNIDIIYNALRQVLDFSIILVMSWYLIRLVRINPKTRQIIGGILAIIVLKYSASVLKLTMVTWIMDYIMIWGGVGIIVVLQPELRLALEKMGNKTIFVRQPRKTISEIAAKELKKALIQLSATRTGALITIEKTSSMDEYVPSGTVLDAVITAELLRTIFFINNPLHDGAVIIRNNRIMAAGAFYPSTNKVVSKSHGARHRAAVAISELTDSITFVVSEETGRISVAQEGKLITLKEEDIQPFIHRNILNRESKNEAEGAKITKKTTRA